MGIRFYCPQGHKLNVKSFLAGKTGICPHCSARMQIPLTSTRPSSKDLHGKSQAEQSALPVASPLEDLDDVLPAEVATLIGAPSTDVAAGERPTEAMQFDSASSSTGNVGGDATAEIARDQPPVDAATTIWWVCLEAGGQQYGPAKEEVIRAWIAEGRVERDHLVWREGWSDWKRAGDCFPQFGSETTGD